MTTCEKPDHHKIAIDVLRRWRRTTNVDHDKTVCAYCDEDLQTARTISCSNSCGTYQVWVDLTTFATINLDLDGVLK